MRRRRCEKGFRNARWRCWNRWWDAKATETTEEGSSHPGEKRLGSTKRQRDTPGGRENGVRTEIKNCKSVESEENHRIGPRWSQARNQPGMLIIMKNPNSSWLRFLATALCLVFWLPGNPAGATVLYWDNNGTGTPSGGIWDTSSSDWATSSTLTSSPGVWNTADAAGFCAGSTSAGTITVSVNSTIALAGFFNGDLGQPGC